MVVNLGEEYLPKLPITQLKIELPCSKRITERWASISVWVATFESGWIGYVYACFERQNLQLMGFNWKSMQMFEIGRALICLSHGEAFWMGRIEASSVWIALEVTGLMIAELELHYSTCSA
ncbi:unnamed protein product [Prunus armeniaca]